MISAVILTKNEADNIEECLKTVDWCNEVIIIDDYSCDGTIDRISNYELRFTAKKKIRIHLRRLDGDFAGQRNFALRKAKGPWVIFVDADERVSSELAKEIKDKILTSQQSLGFYLKRNDFFLGKWLKHGETGNLRLLRLGKKGNGQWMGKVHEKWEINGETDILENPLGHYPHKNVSAFLTKINYYSDLVAGNWIEGKRKMEGWEIIFFPLGKFLQNYIAKLGFLDGVQGFIMAAMMSFHSFLARGKYWISKKQKGSAMVLSA